jgi:hypothetical protein
VQATLILGLRWAESNGYKDLGNAGAVYYILGIMLAFVTAPIAGALTVVGVERMIASLSKAAPRES